MDLIDLTAAVRAFAQERDWERFHTPKNLAVSVSIEAGELLEIVQWKNDDEVDADLGTDAGRDALSDELADILIYLVRLADVVGIDLVAAADQKLRKNASRFPPAGVETQST